MAVAEVEAERDPAALRAARILVSLRSRKLAAWPEWVPNPAPEREASYAEASPATAPAEVAKTWAARRPRSRGRRGSCFPWRKALRELLDLAGSGGVDEDERYAAPAPASARRTVEAALCHGAAGGSGSPSTSSADRAARSRSRSQPRHADEKAAVQAQAKPLAAAAAKEPMKAPSPDTPLDYGAGGSGASSSADDAARPRGKRRSPGARGSGGGGADDDEGCSSPAKRARAAAGGDEKPIPAEQSSMQIETRESSSKGFALDLNLPPPLDDDAY
ncbi:unnamed protein product [Urochloa decumbens]|uniref:Uncharacterized protein n=1 Tax=Urochloa decumbens TaxID=240449 RepID=A0ABC9C1B3_9POAL